MWAGWSKQRRQEAVFVVLLLAVSAWWGASSVSAWRAAGLKQSFYQEYFEPAAMIACGFGFVRATPFYGRRPMDDFLHLRVDAFDCASLPAGQGVSADGLAQQPWFYLMWMVGLFWKVAGVSWSGLVPLFGALFAVVIGLAYAIFRLAVPPWAAGPAAVALMLSPLHLQNLPHLRDYAKAPFVLGLLLILFCIVTRPTLRRVIALSALYGFVLGVGYGFRSDFLANIPPFILVVLCFVPGFTLRDVAAKCAALTVAAVLFVAMSWPVVSYVVRQGGCQWHTVLLGMEHHFNGDLGITPSYYQWVTRYSDEYIHTTVNSFLYRAHGAPPVPYCSTDYDAATASYLMTIAEHFPADVLTRAYASTLRIIDLPSYLFTATTLERSRTGHMLTYLAGTARLSACIAVLLIGAASWRLGLFALFVVLYFGSYPSLQFAPRHFFHLEFIGWWAVAFVCYHGVRVILWRTHRADSPWPGSLGAFAGRGLRFAAVAALLVVLPVPIVRAYQDSLFTATTDTLLNAARQPVAMAPDANGADLRLDDGGSIDLESDPTGTMYLDVRIDLAACPAGVPLGVRYDSSDPFHDFSSSLAPQPRGIVVERFLVPVFRGFNGLSLGGAPARCVTSTERLESVTGLVLLPTLTLPANWPSLPAHQKLGPTALRLWGYGR